MLLGQAGHPQQAGGSRAGSRTWAGKGRLPQGTSMGSMAWSLQQSHRGSSRLMPSCPEGPLRGSLCGAPVSHISASTLGGVYGPLNESAPRGTSGPQQRQWLGHQGQLSIAHRGW